ncbi:MAG: fibronectin type III domain-containing protein [bacterium]|nr:fibronectin type III domain-containing protein [bacterium]
MIKNQKGWIEIFTIGAIFVFSFPLAGCGSSKAKPSSPTNLQAAAVSSSQIDLNWTDNSDDEDGFKIERKISDSSYALVSTLSANATSYPDTGLTSGTTYYYRVSAFNSEGDSGYSNEVTATTLNNAVAADITFTGLADIMALSDTEVMLFWAPAVGDSTPQSEIVYDICQSGTSGACAANFTTAYTTGPNIWNYTISGLAAGQTYYFLVRARDNAGNRDTNVVEKRRGYLLALQISAGRNQTCARLSDNTIKCWGGNRNSNPGFEAYMDSYTPVAVPGINTAAEVSVGGDHACARLIDNTIKCWGSDNYLGQLGNGTNTYSTTPVTVSGITTAVEISAGGSHTCARLSDNTIKCWGRNGYGTLGNGSNSSYSVIPVTVSGITTAAEISAGSSMDEGHTCARLTDNTIRCWGYNSTGQLGDGTGISSNVPVAVIGITTASEISTGFDHTCARLNDNTVKCWGDNYRGQLGNGTNTASNTPVTVFGINTAAEISAGGDHTCIRLTDNTVKCWGDNHYGQLGNGKYINSNTPVVVSGVSEAAEISAGWGHACARLSDSTIKCWGNNQEGELGNGGNMSYSVAPIAVYGITTVSEISVGGEHSCARLTDNTIKCWGLNNYGQLGDGTNTDSNTPVTVFGINTAAEISAGGDHTCVRLTDNTVKCWGNNHYGQLGDGTSTDSNTPVTVVGITTAAEISVGKGSDIFEGHTCARLADNTIKCWGDNYSGQLGNGTNTHSNIPITVSGINSAVKISTGNSHTCAILSDYTIKCWGSNSFGQLGRGTNSSSNTPVSVSEITTAAEISTGYYHTCAILTDNNAKCWGDNQRGQLGDGTFTGSNSPVVVSGINTATEITTGIYHTCARLTNNTVKCWGLNFTGQLVNGEYTASLAPVTISGITSATEISAGIYHTCARLADTTIRCWGGNDKGQLGAGYFNDLNTPVPVISP